MNKLYVSHSPSTPHIKPKKGVIGGISVGPWRKSVKTTKGIGGNIFANAFGKTKEESENNAADISMLPELIEFIKYVGTWTSYDEHPIGRKARDLRAKIKSL